MVELWTIEAHTIEIPDNVRLGFAGVTLLLGQHLFMRSIPRDLGNGTESTTPMFAH